MKAYHNLLYISHGTADETEAMTQALRLAQSNEANLSVLIVGPKFPEEFPAYREKYEQSLKSEVAASLTKTKQLLNIDEPSVPIKIDLLAQNSPAISIISKVIELEFDMVIKEARYAENEIGFQSLDMELIRKCPCALWLCRPIRKPAKQIQVAVAIDPDITDSSAKALSKRMLELSSSLSVTCNGKLEVISCWEYEFEEYLRNTMWIDVSDSEVQSAIARVETEHSTRLNQIIESTPIHERPVVNHRRGRPEDVIPAFVKMNEIDILVMGTVARTGIQNLLLGNTAENIMQRLSCSLLALKPAGFVSPVRAAKEK